ncbi:MAG: hypothetical protein HYS56_02260, partial [Candidatus Omnitrophica bacterium]|nr:hypothetical protein [Candidatus Omnitrophota bacterium]
DSSEFGVSSFKLVQSGPIGLTSNFKLGTRNLISRSEARALIHQTVDLQNSVELFPGQVLRVDYDDLFAKDSWTSDGLVITVHLNSGSQTFLLIDRYENRGDSVEAFRERDEGRQFFRNPSLVEREQPRQIRVWDLNKLNHEVRPYYHETQDEFEKRRKGKTIVAGKGLYEINFKGLLILNVFPSVELSSNYRVSVRKIPARQLQLWRSTDQYERRILVSPSISTAAEHVNEIGPLTFSEEVIAPLFRSEAREDQRLSLDSMRETRLDRSGRDKRTRSSKEITLFSREVKRSLTSDISSRSGTTTSDRTRNSPLNSSNIATTSRGLKFSFTDSPLRQGPTLPNEPQSVNIKINEGKIDKSLSPTNSPIDFLSSATKLGGPATPSGGRSEARFLTQSLTPAAARAGQQTKEVPSTLTRSVKRAEARETVILEEKDLVYDHVSGTAGIRALDVDGFTLANAGVGGIAFVQDMRERFNKAGKPGRLRLAVAYDARPGHRAYAEHSFLAGLIEARKLNVELIFVDQVVPVFLPMELTQEDAPRDLRADAVLFWTASHNPIKGYNKASALGSYRGAKILIGGTPLPKKEWASVTKKAKAIQAIGSYRLASTDDQDAQPAKVDWIGYTVRRIKEIIDWDSLVASLIEYKKIRPNFRLIVDAMHGSTAPVVAHLYDDQRLRDAGILLEVRRTATMDKEHPEYLIKLETGEPLKDKQGRLLSWKPDPTDPNAVGKLPPVVNEEDVVM